MARPWEVGKGSDPARTVESRLSRSAATLNRSRRTPRTACEITQIYET